MPPPFGPTIPTICPAETSRFKPDRMIRSPNDRAALSMTTTGARASRLRFLVFLFAAGMGRRPVHLAPERDVGATFLAVPKASAKNG